MAIPHGEKDHAIAVRCACAEDVAALANLNGTVQELHARLYPDDFKQIAVQADVQQFFSGILKNSASVIALAEVDSSPVGYVWFDLQSRPGTPFTPARRRLYLHHISVIPKAQHRGIGSALMKYVEQRAVSEAAEEIALATWSANLDAQCFFLSHGFTSFTVALRKTLVKGR